LAGKFFVDGVKASAYR